MFRPQAFEKCTALRQLNIEQTEYDPTNLTRCLPECCFLEAGIVTSRGLDLQPASAVCSFSYFFHECGRHVGGVPRSS